LDYRAVNEISRLLGKIGGFQSDSVLDKIKKSAVGLNSTKVMEVYRLLSTILQPSTFLFTRHIPT